MRADARRGLFDLFDGPRRTDDVGAHLRERDGDAATDAAPGAGDDRHAPVHSEAIEECHAEVAIFESGEPVKNECITRTWGAEVLTMKGSPATLALLSFLTSYAAAAEPEPAATPAKGDGFDVGYLSFSKDRSWVPF
jgi:hypothetical protein